MDQDIHFQHNTVFASGSTLSTYMPVPYECTLRNVTGIVQDDPGDDKAITVKGGGTVASGAGGAATTLGTLTFGSGIAAGAVGDWAADATNGGLTLLAGSILKMESDSGDKAVDVNLDIELDPYAR